MDDMLIRNNRRKRTTNNRYVIDSNCYWCEELHPRIENLSGIIDKIKLIVNERINDNIWGFPVDEQSITNTQEVFYTIINDYFNLIKGRRTWVYTETEGYWTEEKIGDTIAYAFIIGLWDIGKNMLIENYPLVPDDLRHRSGKTHSYDNRETYQDNTNKLNTASKQYTQQDSTRNKIMEENNGTGTDTTDSRNTSNKTNINDSFLSPQDQGVTPSGHSADLMNRTEPFQTPDNMGVEELKPNGNPSFTTATNNQFEADTSTIKEGRASTSRDTHNRVDEKEYVEGNDTQESAMQAENNVSAKAGNDTGHERQEVLDISGVLQGFYDIFKNQLLLKIDNRMLPFFLNMSIARFTDHRIGRGYYE